MLMASALIVAGIIMLAWSADRFVDSAAAIAAGLCMPPMMIGLTIVAIGTSLPELVASVASVMKHEHRRRAAGRRFCRLSLPALSARLAASGLVMRIF